jgi:flagellar biosynthesis protein FliR
VKGIKHIIYLSLALGMLIYAMPQLKIGEGLTLPTVFGIVWICLTLTVIAAQLHEILGVDAEMKRELSKVRRMRIYQQQRRLFGKSNLLQMKK